MHPQDDVQHRFLYELGEGSYGVVYLAEDRINGGRLAIKIPKPNDQVDIALLERSLWEEIGHLTQLCPYDAPHPNIVQPKGVKRFRSEEGVDLLGILTEFVPGRIHPESGRVKGCDIETYLLGVPRRQENLSREKLVRAVGQVCDALAHAHRKKVFHRDIKPNNILVRLPDETIKVADWGVAKNIEMDGLWEGSIVGTRPYMAPEVLVRMDLYRPVTARASQRIDHRADIYSLGATVFKIAVGRHPFRSPHEIGSDSDRAAQQSALAAVVGSALAKTVMKALEHDADLRYQNVAEFSRALLAALKSQEADAEAVCGETSGARPGYSEATRTLLSDAMQKRLDEVETLVREGNRDGSAERKYQSLIADFPLCAAPYLDYARYCAACRTQEDAVRILSQGIENAPQQAELYFQRGRIYRSVNRNVEALSDLETALRLGLGADQTPQAQRLLNRLRPLAVGMES